jgi:phosphoserine phosphatase
MIPLEEVYGRRLDIIRPGRTDLTWLGRRYVESVVTGARETVAALEMAGCEIHVASGGLRPAVVALAADLGLPGDRVHAVDIHFDRAGGYAGFETDSPLVRTRGKADVIKHLQRPDLPSFMIGDGVTDLEATAAGAVTIGFGGVVARASVKNRADHFVAGPSLEPVVTLINQLTVT